MVGTYKRTKAVETILAYLHPLYDDLARKSWRVGSVDVRILDVLGGYVGFNYDPSPEASAFKLPYFTLITTYREKKRAVARCFREAEETQGPKVARSPVFHLNLVTPNS